MPKNNTKNEIMYSSKDVYSYIYIYACKLEVHLIYIYIYLNKTLLNIIYRNEMCACYISSKIQYL